MTPEDLPDVRRVIDLCNRHEGLDLPFNLEAGPDWMTSPNHFLRYDGDILVGVVSLQGGREVEVSLGVHPDHRRQGIGRSLLHTAGEEAKRRGRSHLLLVCEEASRSGRAFVKAVGGRYRFSEYRMRLDPRTAQAPRSRQDRIRLQQAAAGDVDLLARLIAVSFDRSEDDERARIANDLQRASHRFFIARANGEPVGSLGVAAFERRIYIIAFNVLPQFRGRGYGRQMLAQTVAALRSEAWDEIMLEVATDNRDALAVYRSCGFHEVRSFGYYHLDL